MSKVNFSLDIETLGRSPGSVIFAIGCVPFNKYGPSDTNFYQEINIEDSRRLGFRTCPKTLTWWGEQAPEARKNLESAANTAYGVLETLCSFSTWVRSIAGEDKKNVVMWGNGSDFDNAFLVNYYARFNMDPPWFKGARCLRTIKEMYPGFEPKRTSILHNALDDAEHQARWIINILSLHAPRMLGD
jgi:hypothetical protein